MKTKDKISGYIIRSGALAWFFLTGIFIALFAMAGPWEAGRQAGAQVDIPSASPFAPSETVKQAWVARRTDPQRPDFATAMAVDASGNVYVTGESFGSRTDLDYTTT